MPGNCRAEFFRVSHEGRELIWSRHLLNDRSPVRAFVPNSGECVVTIDEWHNVGQLPIVIYGAAGELIKAHNLESLNVDLSKVIASTSSVWWDEDALMFFGPDDRTFIIRLSSGQIIVLKLRSGRVLDVGDAGSPVQLSKGDRLAQYINIKSTELAVKYLASNSPEERKTGAIVAGQLKITAAIPKLIELLDDPAQMRRSRDGTPYAYYYVRDAAKTALELLGEQVPNIVIWRQAD